MFRWALVAALLATGAAQAEMTTSPRPLPRPAALGAVAAVADPAPVIKRPMPRPATLQALPQAVPVAELAAPPKALVAPPLRPMPRPAGLAPAVAEAVVAVSSPPAAMPRPRPRPEGLLASASATEAEPKRGGLAALFGKGGSKKPVVTDGYVCDDPDIRGDELAPMTSKVKGCGIEAPVRVTSVDGIRLRGTATIDCTAAKALKTWIDKGMRPSFQKEVVELQIAGSYVCRPRNNIRGNRISEHGRGKAVDIAAFIFADGSVWTVKHDYNRQIRKAHKAACGIFGTTLGPGSDGYHEDHLHFDTASYRNGPYCR